MARELKYFTPDTNLTALERELAAAAHAEEYEDKWAHLVDDEDDDTDEDDATNPAAQTA
ncbi:MAG: hypothetical protein B7Y93_09350 [Micrococcales bacterium 32-70-13]|nr:MAG: hypothetical protein B7Y93_09350 [Micrococcales bacterium 32-70-13]